MSNPTLLVEIAFADTPTTVSPTWTDVSAYVRDVAGVSISRGKNSELETFAASSCQLVLNNRDRRFDPEYGSSPYNLVGRKQVRVSAVWNATTYRLFRGVLESFPQGYAPGNVDAVCPITAYDWLAYMAEERLDDAAYLYARDAFSDASLGRAYRFMSNGEWVGLGDPLYKRRGITATGSSLAAGPGTPVEFNGSTLYAVTVPASPGVSVPGPTAGAYSCWVQTESVGASSTQWAIIMEQVADTNGDVSPVRIGVDSNGYLRVKSGTLTAMSVSKINDGSPHHVLVSLPSATSYAAIYIDGQDATDLDTFYASGTVFSVGEPQYVGGPSGAVAGDTFITGTVQDVWAWTYGASDPTDAEIRTLYELAAGSYVETTAGRADRILDAAGFPAGLVDLTTTPSGEVGDIGFYGQSPLTLLQTVADSEQGRLFCAADGKVTLHERYWWVGGGAATSATINDTTGTRFQNVTMDRPLRELQNDITVTGSAGITSRTTDATSVTSYGTRSATVSTILSRQSLVDDMSVGLVQLRKDAVTRLGQIVVKPGRDDSWATTLALDIGDRVVLTFMPVRRAATTTTETFTVLVERINWSITQTDWTLTLLGSPVPTFSPFVLDSSSLNGTDLLGF